MPEWKPEILRRLPSLNLAPAREAEIADGRGVRVLPRSGPRAAANTREKFSRQLKRLVAQAIAEGLPPRTLARELGMRAKHSPKGTIA
jgi:hypothetical protein